MRVERLHFWSQVTSRTLLLTAGFLLGACLDDGDFAIDDDTATDDDDTAMDDDDAATDDDSASDEMFRIDGAVYIVPVTYEENADGQWLRRELEWVDISPAGYPYGDVYVSVVANHEDTANPLTSMVQSPIPSDPKTVPSPFNFAMQEWPLDTVYVMAAADTLHDGVISVWDSSAFFPSAFDTTAGAISNADIYIDVEYAWDSEGGGWVPGGGHGGSGSPGDPGDPGIAVSISGDIFLHDSSLLTASGGSLVALFDESNGGPYWTALPGNLDGSNQDVLLPWVISINGNFSTNILGAWDSNDNALFEPSDQWGATVSSEEGEIVNPWSIGEVDIAGMFVRVPVEGAGLPVVPLWVSISGQIATDGTFEFPDLDPSLTLGVTANKVPSFDPGADLLALAWGHYVLEDPYNWGPTVPYEFMVPANVRLYLVSCLKDGTDPDDHAAPLDGYHLVGPDDAVAVDVGTSDVSVDLIMTYEAP